LNFSSSSELDESSLEKSKLLKVAHAQDMIFLMFFFLLCLKRFFFFVVIIVVVVVLVGVVILLPLGVVGDEVGSVTALEAALGVLGISSPLLSKLVHHPKFPCKQDNLIIGNALILLIRNCSKRRQNKL
jgi:hypothetical protein